VQQSGPKDIGFFGTRNMGFLHQNLIEVLSYAMVLTVWVAAHFAQAQCDSTQVVSGSLQQLLVQTGFACRKTTFTPLGQLAPMQLSSEGLSELKSLIC